MRGLEIKHSMVDEHRAHAKPINFSIPPVGWAQKFGPLYSTPPAKVFDAMLGVLHNVSVDFKLHEALRGWAKESGYPIPTDTPARMTHAWDEMLSGYKVNVPALLKTFDGPRYDGLVVVGPIPFYSLCEHHMLPFHGRAWVGYLPNASTGRIVGLSKLARLVQAHARRLQVQERLTHDIAADLIAHLKAHGAGCRVESVHTCMSARGVNKEAVMRTQTLLGQFRRPEVRAEFVNLCRQGE